MPTYDYTPTFRKDYAALDPADKERFQRVVRDQFVPDLIAHHFRSALRVKGVRGARGVFEMTWAPDGRATFQYGAEQVIGEPHIVWRRVGTHDVSSRP
jgi:hypothetical protein